MDAHDDALPAAIGGLTDAEIDEAFRQNYGRIARVIARVVRDRGRAEELAVDAFLTWWRKTGARGDGASTWMYRVAVRLAIDELRRDARRERYERILRAFPARTATPEDLHAAGEDQRRVRAVLSSHGNVEGWVTARMASLSPAEGWQPNPASHVTELHARRATRRTQQMRWTAAAVVATAIFVAVPVTRAFGARCRTAPFSAFPCAFPRAETWTRPRAQVLRDAERWHVSCTLHRVCGGIQHATIGHFPRPCFSTRRRRRPGSNAQQHRGKESV